MTKRKSAEENNHLNVSLSVKEIRIIMAALKESSSLPSPSPRATVLWYLGNLLRNHREK